MPPHLARFAWPAGILAVACAGAFVGARIRAVPALVEARVRISESGTCSIAQNLFDCRHLGAQLQTAHAAPRCRIVLDPDPNAPLEAVQAAITSARASAYRQVEFATRAKAAGGG